jgi:ferredoxin, 2Fe-2S
MQQSVPHSSLLGLVDIVVRLTDGGHFAVSAPAGSRVIDAIRRYGLPLKAECEGRCHCASCHVRVAAPWADRLEVPNAAERATLSAIAGAGPRSRLICQLDLTPDLDGLDIEIDPASLVPQTNWVAG